jgi:hypothetical protein
MWEEKTKYASRPTNRSALPTSAALPQLPYYEVVLLSMSNLNSHYTDGIGLKYVKRYGQKPVLGKLEVQSYINKVSFREQLHGYRERSIILT